MSWEKQQESSETGFDGGNESEVGNFDGHGTAERGLSKVLFYIRSGG